MTKDVPAGMDQDVVHPENVEKGREDEGVRQHDEDAPDVREERDVRDEEILNVVADDTPLPPGWPGAPEGGEQGDGLAPRFSDDPRH